MQKDLFRKRKRRGVEPKNRDTDLMANSHGDQDGLVVSNEEDDNADSHGDQDDLTVFHEDEDNWVDVDDADAGGENFFPTNVYEPAGGRSSENPQGQNGPHFSSYTSAAFSVFLAVSRLPRRTYNALIRVIRHPHFLPSDVPSYSQAKRLLRGVRTITTHIRNLPVKTAASGKTSTPAYSHSVVGIIKRAMESQTLRSHMFFGAGQRVEYAREIYHGDLWKESPLFGSDCVVNSAGTSECF
jgi:hypothetical protein